MEKVEVTWPLAIKIWWSYTWRVFLLSFIAGFVAAIPIGFIGALVNIPQEKTQVISGVIGLIIGLFAQAYVMKKLLNKKYKKFSIALIREEA
ncbi:MAG: hypothetical protein O2970_10345 [Proteobacteria bacterium]|nr:hypothetical protein [Pseudomonadota bacterium]MDA0967341.1 hypothetical protein [Pseudomonadota bacterium]